MAVSVVTGVGSEYYWARESAFGNGGSGMPATATATHQTFNPAEGDINIPIPYYEQEQHYTTESNDPNANYTHDSKYTPGEGTHPNGEGEIWHDPMFMLATVFPNKTVSGTWAGGAATYGKIVANFSALTYEDTVMIQYLTKDLAGNTIESKSVLGVKATHFRIGFKKGGLLRAWYDLISAQSLDNTRAFTTNASYDDGRWADWALSTYYLATACKIYWDDSFAAELSDIKIEEAYFDIDIPQDYLTESSTLVPFARNNKQRMFTAEITGIVIGNTEIAEYRAAYTSKTKKNLRLQWDTTASEEKFIDIDDAFIEKMTETPLKNAGEAWRVTLTFKGHSCDFEGNYENLPDPTTGTRVNGA